MEDRFAGRYELVDPLGEGGAGVVWRAWDHREGGYVAAKILRQVDATSLIRFVREQGVRIQHRHLLTPLGWAGDDERVMLVMPVVDGGSAATLVGDHGPLPPVWVATLLDQLLQALAQLHGEGFVHRDVKPANLLLDATGTGVPRSRLADFGLATSIGDPRLTAGPYVLGTRGYLAPEALAAGWDPDPAADLFAAGMTARELLTGVRPEGADHDRVAAELIRARVPHDLAAVVLDLVAEHPGDRPASAQEAVHALQASGLVARDAEDLGGEVEVLEQLPPLPEGWGPQGRRVAGTTPSGVALPPVETDRFAAVGGIPAPGAPGPDGAPAATTGEVTQRYEMPRTAQLDERHHRAVAGASAERDRGTGPLVSAGVAVALIVLGLLLLLAVLVISLL